MNTSSICRLAAAAFVFGLSAACAATPDDVSTSSSGELRASNDATSDGARFETFEGRDGLSYFHLIAKNGENLLRSEGYANASNAKRAIMSVAEIGGDTEAYDVLEAMTGEYYFNLVAHNGEIVGTSELYATKWNAERGVRATIVAILSTPEAPPVVSARREAKFETFRGHEGDHYFRVRAGNGEIVLASEGYERIAGAENGIASVKENGVDASHYEIVETKVGEYGIRLLAKNGEIIARGESYSTRANATRAIDTLTELLASIATGS